MRGRHTEVDALLRKRLCHRSSPAQMQHRDSKMKNVRVWPHRKRAPRRALAKSLWPSAENEQIPASLTLPSGTLGDFRPPRAPNRVGTLSWISDSAQLSLRCAVCVTCAAAEVSSHQRCPNPCSDCFRAARLHFSR